MQNQIDQIDKAAEVDSSLFWRMINARRKKSNSSPGLELIFNDRHCNTSTEINNEWAKYFAKLYTPTQAAHFNDAFSETIRTEMVNIRNDLEKFSETESFPVISVGEIESALKLTQRNKAGGEMA